MKNTQTYRTISKILLTYLIALDRRLLNSTRENRVRHNFNAIGMNDKKN